MTGRFIIISDLDGTILDSKYSFENAVSALDLLKRQGIPLVLCSSKTRPEMELYRRRLGNKDPFICENGGGIFIPEGYFPFGIDGERKGDYRVITLGEPYVKIRNVFSEIRRDLGIRALGFGDLSTMDVAALTGLPPIEASLAIQREFDEPFIFGDKKADKDRFLEAVESSGLQWTAGRFYHVLGENDKGKAVKILKALYEKAYGKIRTIGLGDGLNDIPMLKETDYPVIIPKEGGFCKEVALSPKFFKAHAPGPCGWDRAVRTILKM